MGENAEAVARAVAAFNVPDLDTYLELYDPSVVLHGYGPEPIDRDGARAFYQMVLSAFPEPTLTVDDLLEQGDKIAVRYTLTGTHQGEFMGVPPTGNPIVLAGQTIFRFAGGRVVERWQSADMLGLMVQIGAVPPPGA